MAHEVEVELDRAYERIAEFEAICLTIRNVETGDEQLDPAYTEQQRAEAKVQLEALLAKLGEQDSTTSAGFGK